jgi:hypothetical protein
VTSALSDSTGKRSRRTTGAELLAHAFATLAPDEQEEAFSRIVDARVERLAAEEDETAYFLRSLRRVADASGGELTPDGYRAARRRLVVCGDDIAEVGAVIRHFGTWRRAKEALGLSEVTTATKIEARFRARLAGRQRTFNEAELREALARCVGDLGRIPLVAEYDEWRLRELALARTRGEAARVPSSAVFRRRHRTWEKALLEHGYSPDEIYLRLEPTPERRDRLAKVDRYSEETLRATLLECVAELGHVPLVDEFEAWRRRVRARSRARRLVLPSDSPYRRRYGSWEKALLHFGFSEGEIAERLADGRRRSDESLRRHGFGAS